MFLCSRDKKEIMDFPQDKPQKDKKYACCHFSFHKTTRLWADSHANIVGVLAQFAPFLGRAWRHGPPWTAWPWWTKGRKSALSHKLKLCAHLFVYKSARKYFCLVFLDVNLTLWMKELSSVDQGSNSQPWPALNHLWGGNLWNCSGQRV